MVISCDDCVMQHTAACADCVVTHVLGAETDGVVLDVAAERAVRLLVRAGLVPALRHATAGLRRRRAGGAPVRWRRAPPRPAADPRRAARARRRARHRAPRRGAGDGARAGPRRPPRAARRRAGRRDGVHVPQPRPLHRPVARRARRPVDHRRAPAPTSPTTSRHGRPVPRRASPATPGSTTTPRCGSGCGRSPAACGPPTSERCRSPTTTRSSTARSPTGPGSAGSARTPTCCCRAPAAGSCSAASITTAAYPRRRRRWPTAAARATAASTPARPGAIVAPGRDRRQPLPRLGAAAPGYDPGRAPAGRRRPPLRLRRLPGGVPADRPPRPPPPAARSTADAEAWVDVLDLLDADDRTLLDRHGRWYIAGRDPRWLRRNALVVLGNTADRRRRAGRRHAGPLPRRRRPGPRRARPLGERAARPVRRRPPRRGRRRGEAPARDERLPAQDRRDPVAAVGVVAAAAARPLRRAHQPVRRRRAVRQRPAVPHRADPRAGAAARTRGWCAASTTWPARSAPTSSCSTRPCRSGSSARRCELPYDVVLHGAEVTVPGRLPGTKQALGNVLRRARHVVSAGRVRRREAERAAGRSLPVTVVPPGRRRRALPARSTPAERAAARQRFGLPGGRRADRVDLPARAAQGLRRGDRGGRPAGAAAAPTSCWRSPAAGATSGGCAGWPPSAGRRCAFLGRVANDRPAAPVRLRRRVHDGVPLAVGRPRAGGLRHRVRRGRGVRRAAGRRRLGRCGRGGRRRRHRPRRAPARRPARGRRGVRGAARRRRAAGRRWPRRRERGPWPSSPTTCWPSASAQPSVCGERWSDEATGGDVGSMAAPTSPAPRVFALTAALAGGVLHDVLAVGRRDHRARAVRRRRVRLPVVVLQRRAAQPARRDRGGRPVPPARSADAAAGAPHHARRCCCCSSSIAVVTTFARLDGPDGKPGSSLALGFLVPMFGFGLNGLWAAYHGDFPRRRTETPRPGSIGTVVTE